MRTRIVEGASCSLVKYGEKVYPSANTRYRYNHTVLYCGQVIAVTHYRQRTTDGGEYTYLEAIPYVSHLI